MKIITKIREISPYLYYIFLLGTAVVLTFFNAGHTFNTVSVWVLNIIPMFIFWLLTPKKNYEIIKEYLPIFLFTFIFSIWFVFGMFFPPFAHYGYIDFMLFIVVYFIFLATVTIKWEKKHIRFMLKTLCGVVFVFSLYGIFKYITEPFYRITGPFHLHDLSAYFPNAFSFLLMIVLPIQILYLFNQSNNEKWTFPKIYFYISSTVIITALFLIYSRSSIIALLVLSIIFILVQLSQAVKRKAFFSGKAIRTLLFILIISFILIGVVNRVRGLEYETETRFEKHLDLDASEHSASFQDRFDYMRAGVSLINDYPLFGIGLNNFQYFYPKYQNNAILSKHPHNFILKLTTEGGIVLGLCLISIFGFILYSYFKKLGQIEQKYYTATLGFSLLASSIISLIDYNINFVINSAIMGFIAGLFLSRFPVKKKNSKCCKVLAPIYLLFISLLAVFITFHEFTIHNFVNNAEKEILKSNYLNAADLYEQAGDKAWFKEDFYIKSSNLFKKEFEKEGGISYENLNKWRAVSKKATEVYPFNSFAWFSYANSLCVINFDENAINTYKKALDIDPHNNFEYIQNYLSCKSRNLGLTEEDKLFFKNKFSEYIELLKENPYISESSYNIQIIKDMYSNIKETWGKDDKELELLYYQFNEIVNGGQERT